MTTSTETLDKPLEDTTTGDDTPKMFHYVRKAKIAESAVHGQFRGGAVRGDVPGHQVAEAGLTGLPGLQEDLRIDEEGLTAVELDRRRCRSAG